MSITETVVSLDRLLGDIAAYEYLLAEVTAERDAYRRQVETMRTQLATAHAKAYQ